MDPGGLARRTGHRDRVVRTVNARCELPGVRRTLQTVYDETDQPLGWLALNSSAWPCASGGVRCTPDVSSEVVRDLADAMTWKFAFLRMPFGGAKSGIRSRDSWSPEHKARAVERFGEALGPLLRAHAYGSGPDMGFGASDHWRLLKAAGRNVGATPPDVAGGGTGAPTAATVFACARGSLRSQGLEIAGARVAIQGFGSVGSDLARRFAEEGARVVAVSNLTGAIHADEGLDISRLLESRAELGDEGLLRSGAGDPMEPNQLLELEVDVLSPCAAGGVVTPDLLPRLRCRVLVPGANCVLHASVQPESLDALGISYVPDWVASGGGVFAANLPGSDSFRRRVLEEVYPERIAELFDRAAGEGISFHRVARDLAAARLARVSEDPTIAAREHVELQRTQRLSRNRWRRFEARAAASRIAENWLPRAASCESDSPASRST